MQPQINQNNNLETHKKTSFLKVYLQEAKKMGWKQFWKQNDKAVKFLLKLLLAAFALGVIESTSFVEKIKYDKDYAKLYFLLTLIAFTMTVAYQAWFYFEVGIKQDFNTSQFTRVKEKSFKGVDWKKAEAPYNSKKKS